MGPLAHYLNRTTSDRWQSEQRMTALTRASGPHAVRRTTRQPAPVAPCIVHDENCKQVVRLECHWCTSVWCAP